METSALEYPSLGTNKVLLELFNPFPSISSVTIICLCPFKQIMIGENMVKSCKNGPKVLSFSQFEDPGSVGV
jgi:hypothetical protein